MTDGKSKRWNLFEQIPHVDMYGALPVDSPQRRRHERLFQQCLASPQFEARVNAIRRSRHIRVGKLDELVENLIEVARKFAPGYCKGKLVEKGQPQVLAREQQKLRAYLKRVGTEDVRPLLRDFKLSDLWHESIRHYIFTGAEQLPEVRCAVYPLEDRHGRMRLLLEIFGDTTLTDVQEYWKVVTHYQEQLPDYGNKKLRHLKNLQRDLKAYRLSQQGLKPLEIEEIIQGKEAPQQMQDNEFVYPEAIRQALHRTKRRIMTRTNLD